MLHIAGEIDSLESRNRFLGVLNVYKAGLWRWDRARGRDEVRKVGDREGRKGGMCRIGRGGMGWWERKQQ